MPPAVSSEIATVAPSNEGPLIAESAFEKAESDGVVVSQKTYLK
jgi:hypothetical protein